MSIRLSICIPTYNRKEALDKQLTFFLNEKVIGRPEVEVIVSNNCSTDGTKEYLEDFTRKCDKIYVLNNTENVGLIGNIRKLTELAKGEFIWIVGDDDQLREGIVKKVLEIIETNEVGHIFLNHSIVQTGVIKSESVYSGVGGFIPDGIELFERVTMNSKSALGVLMFITANIYRREDVLKANIIIDNIGETNNLALPLGYSLFLSTMPGYILSEVYVNNSWDDISWNGRQALVWCRDMIAICDKIADRIGEGDRIRKLLIKYKSSQQPALRYVYYKRKFKYEYDNYALKWYLKYFKIELLKDILVVMKKVVKRLIR